MIKEVSLKVEILYSFENNARSVAVFKVILFFQMIFELLDT